MLQSEVAVRSLSRLAASWTNLLAHFAYAYAVPAAPISLIMKCWSSYRQCTRARSAWFILSAYPLHRRQTVSLSSETVTCIPFGCQEPDTKDRKFCVPVHFTVQESDTRDCNLCGPGSRHKGPSILWSVSTGLSKGVYWRSSVEEGKL